MILHICSAQAQTTDEMRKQFEVCVVLSQEGRTPSNIAGINPCTRHSVEWGGKSLGLQVIVRSGLNVVAMMVCAIKGGNPHELMCGF